MGKRTINTSLDEDLQGLGIPGFNMQEQALLGGIPLTEGTNDSVEEEDKMCPKCKADMKDGKCTKCGYKKAEDDDQEGDDQDESIDPLEAVGVNIELFDAIMEIPFEGLKSEDIDEILEALKSKELPEDASDELKERAEEVVDFLIAERAAKVVRRHVAGKTTKKKSRQCPEGTRAKKGKPGCEPTVKAMGGAGKVAKESRKKKKWAKGGAGKKSERKSARVAARREGVESPFAAELMGLMEDSQEASETLRDELIEMIGNVFDLLSEEFNDEAVTRVFTEAYEPVLASWDAGRIDEDVMEVDEFISEIKPVLTLIHKSLDRIGGEDTLGN